MTSQGILILVVLWVVIGLFVVLLLFKLRPEKRVNVQAEKALTEANVPPLWWVKAIIYGLTWFACFSCVIVWPLTVIAIIRWWLKKGRYAGRKTR